MTAAAIDTTPPPQALPPQSVPSAHSPFEFVDCIDCEEDSSAVYIMSNRSRVQLLFSKSKVRPQKKKTTNEFDRYMFIQQSRQRIIFQALLLW